MGDFMMRELPNNRMKLTKPGFAWSFADYPGVRWWPFSVL
jgi:hypothetical protein